MDFQSIKHLIYGFVTGLTEILPISSRAHSVVMLKLLGEDHVVGLPVLLIHLGILTALYTYSRIQLTKMSRARKLSRIPKKKRKRPLDVTSLMDSRFLMTMSIPVIVIMIFYNVLSTLPIGLLLIAAFLFVNGIILYIPQFLPGSNRDARSLSRVDGLLMGIASTLSIFPGFSGIGAALSVGRICGVDSNYSLNMALMLQIIYVIGMIVFDILTIIVNGFGALSLPLIIAYILASAAAFISTMLAIRIMRALASDTKYHLFSYYCWGMAIFVFILNLMA